MEYQIRLENLHPTPTAVVRRRARPQDFSKVVPAACGTVWNVMRAQQVKGAGRHVALYLDCDNNEVNLEVGVELDHPFPGHGEVVPSQLPAGPVATTTHFGPYPHLHHAHRALLDWAKQQGHTLAGPNWEIYGHWLDAWNSDPSKIRTDVLYLLKASRQ